MTATTAHEAPASSFAGTSPGSAATLTRLATKAIYLALALVFVWFGATKFTDVSAAGIAGLVMNSPFVGWWHALLGIKGTALMLGVVEITAGVLLASRLISPRLSTIGAAIGVLIFLVTLSFMFTTPGVGEARAGGFPALSVLPGQFLLKDLVFLAASLFCLGESLAASRPAGESGSVGALTRFAGKGLYLALAVVFLWFGAMKFTDYEAAGIAGLVMNSPFVGWWHALLGIEGTSRMLGVVEITAGLLLAARLVSPRLSTIGAAISILTYVITLTFLFTTPGVPEARAGGFPFLSTVPGQFLLKDVVLLAVSLYCLGESLLARGRRAA